MIIDYSLIDCHKDLGLHLVSVIDYLRIKQVVGLGDGAGGNIIMRFGICHPSRVYGIFTINNRAGVNMGRFMEGLKGKMKAAKGAEQQSMNEVNVSKFAEAYKKRSEILSDMNKKIDFDVLLMAGMKSKYVEDTEIIHKEMAPGMCSMIKVEDISEPLTETPERVTEAILLFCQGIGLMPSVARKFSRQPSQDSGYEGRLIKQITENPARQRFSISDLDATKLPEVSDNFEQVIMG